MKRIKFLILALFIIIPLNVFAFGFSFKCEKTSVRAKEEFTCTLFSDYYYEVNAELVLPTGFELKENNPGKNYKSSSNDTILKYVSTGENENTIAVLIITAPNVNSSFDISLKNIKYKYNSKDQYRTKNDIPITINVTGTVDKNTTTTTTANESSTTEEAKNNYIVSLDPNGGSGDIQSLSCSLIDGKCEVNLENAVTPIKDGLIFKGWGSSNECTEGKTSTYEVINNVTLYACWDSSEDAMPYLSELSIEGYPIEFSKFNYNYTIKVDDNVEDLNIIATAINKEAKVSINKPQQLVEGKNVITVLVKEPEKELTYTINVLKGNVVEESPELSNIEIKESPISFTQGIYIYNVKIKSNVKKLTITVIPPSENVTYSIEGNENLKDGSVITVIAENEISKLEYKINVSVEKTIMDYLNYIIIAGILVFMLLVYFIIRIQKKNETKPKEKKVKEKTVKKERKSKKEKSNTKQVPVEPEEELEVL